MLVSDHAFPRANISRNHLEFYSSIYEDGAELMVYVRDRQSANGTHVNGNLIGMGMTVSPGWLLQDGDRITMKRNMSFKLRMLDFSRDFRMTFIQRKEAELFASRYTISNKILGKGAHCQVRMAINKITGAQVACKIYDLKTMRDIGHLKDIQSVLNAVSIFKKLGDHPNLASFECAYQSQNTLYTFETLAAGGDLWTMLHRFGAFKEMEIRWMMYQVLQGLAHMHEKGIAHRDIKEENIICMACPKPGHRIVITDFGYSQSTQAGRRSDFCGTSGRQAPEQLLNGGSHDIACDMWSIGILAMHLLSGNGHLNTIEAFEKVLNARDAAGIAAFNFDIVFDEIRDYRQLQQLGESLSLPAVDFIRRCLTVDETKRITAAEALCHPWLSEPACTRELFAAREAQNAQTWGPRHESDHKMRLLPDVLATRQYTPVVTAAQAISAAAATPAAPTTSPMKTIWTISGSPPRITVHKTNSPTAPPTRVAAVTKVVKPTKATKKKLKKQPKATKATKAFKITKGGATNGRQKILGVSDAAVGETSRHFAKK